MALRVRFLTRQAWQGYAAMSTSTDTAGTVRAAGGSFSKKEQAQEDQYFHNLEQEQLHRLQEEAKLHHEEEIAHHEEAIKELEEQIVRHKTKIGRHQEKMQSH